MTGAAAQSWRRGGLLRREGTQWIGRVQAPERDFGKELRAALALGVGSGGEPSGLPSFLRFIFRPRSVLHPTSYLNPSRSFWRRSLLLACVTNSLRRHVNLNDLRNRANGSGAGMQTLGSFAHKNSCKTIKDCPWDTGSRLSSCFQWTQHLAEKKSGA